MRDKQGVRYVSFTFDDGLIAGARATADLFERVDSRATFYVVTGWVRPRRMPWIRDVFNRGRDHGSWTEWRELARRGHEIGGHTFSHLNASGRLGRRFPRLVQWEVARAARDLQRHLGESPVSCSMPWNSATTVAIQGAQHFYSAMRLGGPRSTGCNNVPPADWYSLESWAPEPGTPVQEMVARIGTLAVGEWLILQFHSVDDEGYMPIAKSCLEQLLAAISAMRSIRVVTVKDMVRMARANDHVTP